MSILSSLAILYAVACVCVIGFQIALIIGAPWGHVTQGGQVQGSLPVAGRVAAGVSIFLLIGMAGGITSVAGLWPEWPVWTGWVAVAIQGISTVLNWITPSQAERRLWGPITLALLTCASLVFFLS